MFTDWLAEVAMKELSSQEIRAASEFFGTVPGKKLTRLLIVDPFEKTGAPTTEKKPELSPDEHQALYDFTQASAGRKLLTEGVLTRSPLGRKVAMDAMLDLQRNCLREAQQSQTDPTAGKSP